MQIFNNEVTCYVGETFNLNIRAVDRNGQPFIIPRYTYNEMENGEIIAKQYPSFFVFSVAPSVYDTDNIYRLWVRIDTLNQFVSDNPIPQFKYTDVVNMPRTAKVVTINNVKYLWDDTNNDEITDNVELYELTDYVFSYVDANDELHYVYFKGNEADDTLITSGIEYTAPNLQFAFTRDLTTKFGAQSYVYDLRFVACNKLDSNVNIDYSALDILYKQIIVKPTKFKVLYPINEIGGVNNGDN